MGASSSSTRNRENPNPSLPLQGEVRWGPIGSRQTPPTPTTSWFPSTMHDHVTIRIGKGIPAKEQIQISANLAAVIKDLVTPREAATNLEFEKAARLRDEVKRLREMELDTLTGEGN